MPDKLIPGEKKTAVYKKQKFGTPFTMKGSPHKLGTIEGTSAFRDEKTKKAQVAANLKSIDETSLVLSDAMKNLLENEPPKDSPKYASWKIAYDKAAAAQKAAHAQ
jgi:hypothetical protein